jgi:hypothetical protein
MTESLLQQTPPKTTREREPERRGEEYFARTIKVNGRPRYRLTEMSRAESIHRPGQVWVEPRDLPPAPEWTGVCI